MKVDLTRQEVLELWRVIHKQSATPLNKRFEYALAKNRIALQSDIDALKPVLEKELEGQTEWQDESKKLLDKHAEKDDKGNPVQERVPNSNQAMVKLADPEAYEKEMEELQEKYKDYLDARKQYDKETDAWLKEDEKVSVELYGIKFDYLPDEFYNKFEMEVMMPLIVMDEEE